MRRLFVFVAPLLALLGCGGASSCPAGAKLDHGACVRTVVETRVECPTGSRFEGGRCVGQELKVAKVDFVAAFLETFEAKAIQERLKLVYEKHQRDLDQRSNDLKRDKEELEKKGPSLSLAARDQATAEFTRRLDELQKLFADYQKDLQEQQSQALKEGLESSRPALLRFSVEAAKADGFSAVYEMCVNQLPEGLHCDPSKAVWTASGADVGKLDESARWDLTPSVIARYKQDLAGK